MFIFLCLTLSDMVGARAVHEHCEKLWRRSPYACFSYMRQLADDKDFRTLRLIYEYDDSELGLYAAFVTIPSMKDADAVAFCKKFKVGSRRWVATVKTLANRQRALVIPYIKEVIQSRDPIVRYHCYDLCWIAGWDDLLAQASADTCTEAEVQSVAISVDGHGIQLREFAKDYVTRFKKK